MNRTGSGAVVGGREVAAVEAEDTAGKGPRLAAEEDFGIDPCVDAEAEEEDVDDEGREDESVLRGDALSLKAS